MDVKKIVLLVGALIIAAVTAFMAKNMFTGASRAAGARRARPSRPGPKCWSRPAPCRSARSSTPRPSATSPGPRAWSRTPISSRGEGGADPQSLIGTVVRNEITAGQPVTQGALSVPASAASSPRRSAPGMRAVTVAVSATSGVAGFVFPGDRVDLVLTQEVAGGGDGPPLRVSETIIRNIRVLAVDQRINARDEDGNQVAQTRRP